jgi:PAS domain S-box-containing protein
MTSSTKEVTLLIHDTLLIIDCNDAACDLFRCDRETLIGFSIYDLIYSDDFQGLGRLRMRLLREQGHVPPVEYLLQRFDGTRFYAWVNTEAETRDEQYRSTITYRYDD